MKIHSLPGSCGAIPCEVWGEPVDELTPDEANARRERLCAYLRLAGFDTSAPTLDAAIASCQVAHGETPGAPRTVGELFDWQRVPTSAEVTADLLQLEQAQAQRAASRREALYSSFWKDESRSLRQRSAAVVQKMFGRH